MSNLATAIQALDNEITTTRLLVAQLEHARATLVAISGGTPARWTYTDTTVTVNSQNAQFALADAEPPPATPAPPPPPAPAQKRAGRPGRPRKYELADVADAWNSRPEGSAAAGYANVAKVLSITPKAAAIAVSKARKAGLISGTSPAQHQSPPSDDPLDNFDPDDVDWPAVAACYKAATLAGLRPITAIMDQFNVTRPVAKAWPEVCRRLGLLPPADQPQIDAGPAPHQPIRITNPRPVAL